MQSQSTRITLTCPVCGTTFHRTPSAVKAVAVPTCGRVCSNEIRWGSLRERLLAKVDKAPNGCWNWTSNLNKNGYGVIRDRYQRRSAHRVAYEELIGDIPDGLHVLHTCDNPACVNPDHLFLGTHADNMADKHAKGRFRYGTSSGERNGFSKLSQVQVVEIRELHSSGTPAGEIASKFGITREHVWAITARKAWKHVP